MSTRIVSLLAVSFFFAAAGCSGSPDEASAAGADETAAEEALSGNYNRQTVYGWAKSRGADAPGDLLSANETKQKLVNALGWLYGYNAPHFYISALNSDHPTRDGAHGHNGGYCADLYAENSADMLALIQKINANPNVTQVGLGGAYKNYVSHVTKPHFMDNNQTHVHISVY
jgi:hypothetical protein